MRSQRRLFLEYLDSSILLGETMEVCYENIKATVNLLQELGFTIHPEKSVLLLTKKYMLFGNFLDSTIMTIQLTEEMKQTIYSHCEILFTEDRSIEELAQITGVIAFPFKTVTHG